MESLDLYFFKSITYFLVVCMSCIFNKPFELTLSGLLQRTSKGPLSPLSLFSCSLHLILLPYHLAFPAFAVWTPSSDDFSPQLWEKCEGRRQRPKVVVGLYLLYHIYHTKYDTDYTLAVYYSVFLQMHCDFLSTDDTWFFNESFPHFCVSCTAHKWQWQVWTSFPRMLQKYKF